MKNLWTTTDAVNAAIRAIRRMSESEKAVLRAELRRQLLGGK